MKLTFHGAVGMVTGSCYHIACGKVQFLVDCGMFQGNKTVKENNYQPFSFEPGKIDFVLLTHAHIDHSGLLPKLVKHGFTGKIYSSIPSTEMLKYLLPDSARIQEVEVERKNEKLEKKGLDPISPIYSEEDAAKAITLLRGVQQGKEISPGEGVRAIFRNAGHVFGSSFIEIWLKENGVEKKIVFSGDLGGPNHPIVKDPDTIEETDILLIESTYGNRIHPVSNKDERLAKLAEIVKDTMKARGNLIIPSFSFERTQDIMVDFLQLMDRREIPEVDVWIDSPLAINSTKVFTRFPQFYDRETTDLMAQHDGRLFDHDRFKFSLSVEDSKALNGKKGQIILSASGMCDAGRIKHHLKNNLWGRENTILFVGYQAPGTLGRLIRDGAETVRIHSEEIKVEARIEAISGYSGHADQNELMDWLNAIETIRDRIFVIHGEDDAREAFAKLIEEKTKFRTSIPQLHETFDLLESKRDKKAVVTPPKNLDSFNLFAAISLKLAEFMRGEGKEEVRRDKLDKISKILD